MSKKYLIIEDEPISAMYLKSMILKLKSDVEVCGPVSSVAGVVDLLTKENDFDLIFADIKIDGGTVFDAFSRCVPNSFVVFTTAYDNYALKAFKNNGIDYLLKPIDIDELEDTLDRFERCSGSKYNQHKELMHRFANERVGPYKRRFLLNFRDELYMLETYNIAYFLKEDNGVVACDFSGKKYNLSYTMQQLESCLDPAGFFRVNRQYIINFKAIKNIYTSFLSKMRVSLKGCDDCNIIVSRDRSRGFREWIENIHDA